MNAMTISDIKAVYANSNEAGQAILAERYPELFSFPQLARGEKSGCWYVLLDANRKIRLTDGKWTKFRNEIGEVSKGYDIGDYDMVGVLEDIVNADCCGE